VIVQILRAAAPLLFLVGSFAWVCARGPKLRR
jgi:hypothetical protein